MDDYIIATASTCDLDQEWLRSHAIPVISYTFTVDDTIYTDDGRDETKRSLYAAMRAGKLPNTSQINTYHYYEFFKELLSRNKPVMFLDMDKLISASYVNSQQARAMILEESPSVQLEIIDTSCITMGLALLLKTVVRRKESGIGFAENVAWANEQGKHVAHRFLVDDLHWLSRGGRLSNSSALIGSILSIKPLIYLNEEGRLVAYTKVRGKKKATRELLASAQKDTILGNEIIVGHSDCQEEGLKWQESVQEVYPDKQVTLMELGPTIASHVGPGFLSIVYFTDSRKP